MSSLEFCGQTAIVTGATRGIGKAIALAFLAGGARVIGTYRGNRDMAEKLSSENAGLEMHGFDVGDFGAVEAFYKRVEGEIERLDIVVCNSGIRRDGIAATMKQDDWQSVIDTNLTGTFHMARFAIPQMMRNRFGRIVFITSPAGREGFAGQANYAASKAGQVGMMRAISKEVASRGITVNCVSPGFVETEFIADLPPEQAEEYKKRVPMRRFAKPEEIAAGVLFLASKRAAYITGSTLEITGGM